jgi:hypothetical protein
MYIDGSFNGEMDKIATKMVLLLPGMCLVGEQANPRVFKLVNIEEKKRFCQTCNGNWSIIGSIVWVRGDGHLDSNDISQRQHWGIQTWIRNMFGVHIYTYP